MLWSVFRKLLHSIFVTILYGTIVKLYLQENTEVLGDNPVPVPLCPPQISYGQARNRKWVSVVRGRSNIHLSHDTTCSRIKYSNVFYGACSPIAGYGLLILEAFRGHTQRHITVGRTPLDEWSARRRDNTQHSQQTNIHAPGGIRIHNFSRRAAADLRLRPRRHWDRPSGVKFLNLELFRQVVSELMVHLQTTRCLQCVAIWIVSAYTKMIPEVKTSAERPMCIIVVDAVNTFWEYKPFLSFLRTVPELWDTLHSTPSCMSEKRNIIGFWKTWF